MPQTFQQLEQAKSALTQELTRALVCLQAARPYVATCADDTSPNPAETVLAELDAILADNP